MSTAAECAKFQKAISEKYPSLCDVYNTADGLKLYLQQSGDTVIQSMFYNGRKLDSFITIALSFVPAGHIVGEIFNAPGCMNDSQVSK